MNMLARAAIALLALAAASPALAQSGSSVVFPMGYAPGESPCVKQSNGTCVPVDAANPMPTARQDGTPVTVTPASSLNAVLFTADTLTYGGVGFQLTGTLSGTATFQWSDDGTNWVTGQAMNSSGVFVSTAVNSGALSAFYFPAQHRYVRAVLTAYASGTVSGTAYLRYSSVDPTGASTPVTFPASPVVWLSTRQDTLSAIAFSSYTYTAAASTNSTLIASGSHRIVGGMVCNTAASIRFPKFYNKATAPTVGTDTPSAVVPVNAGACVSLSTFVSIYGQVFPLGLGMGITGGIADNDNTAVSAGDVLVSVLYL
jgi:hypothetical protein